MKINSVQELADHFDAEITRLNKCVAKQQVTITLLSVALREYNPELTAKFSRAIQGAASALEDGDSSAFLYDDLVSALAGEVPQGQPERPAVHLHVVSKELDQ